MHARVTSTRWLTPTLVRVVLEGGDLRDFVMPETTDTYINVALRPADAPYPEIFDPKQVRDTLDRSTWPAQRRYTVRSWDPATRRLSLDFVVHGDSGVAGPWAANAEPGAVLVFEGPSGGYRPDPSADWHLMLGDESALPAIAASLEAIPRDAAAVVRLVCDGPAHEVDLTCAGNLDLRWLHRRGGAGDADLLPAATRDLHFPRDRVHAFVHGEADEIRQIRRHLLADRGLRREDMSCSPYWRRDMTDETWRQVKRDFVAAMEAEVA
jgi:NADPH-dependent ferric siderophore reductase